MFAEKYVTREGWKAVTVTCPECGFKNAVSAYQEKCEVLRVPSWFGGDDEYETICGMNWVFECPLCTTQDAEPFAY